MGKLQFWSRDASDQQTLGRAIDLARASGNQVAELRAIEWLAITYCDLRVATDVAIRHHEDALLAVAGEARAEAGIRASLALAYGQAYSERCVAFVLRGIFLFTDDEVSWFIGHSHGARVPASTGMGRFFPEAHRAFRSFIPADAQDDLLMAYYRRLIDPSPLVHRPAAAAWCARSRPRQTKQPVGSWAGSGCVPQIWTSKTAACGSSPAGSAVSAA